VTIFLAIITLVKTLKKKAEDILGAQKIYQCYSIAKLPFVRMIQK
jgi:hypothetical protein